MHGFHLLPYLPNLDPSTSNVTSPRDSKYNCIAWAMEDVAEWWWPDTDGYWPAGVERKATIDAFVAAIATLGYGECDNGSHEPGFTKIAIYANGDGPQHAARQLPNGRWTSKLGRFEDIEHATPEGANCDTYGVVVKWMKKPIS